mgnify:CR=1 FL=1
MKEMEEEGKRRGGGWNRSSSRHQPTLTLAANEPIFDSISKNLKTYLRSIIQIHKFNFVKVAPPPELDWFIAK